MTPYPPSDATAGQPRIINRALRLLGCGATVLALTACGGPAAPTPRPAPTPAAIPTLPPGLTEPIAGLSWATATQSLTRMGLKCQQQSFWIAHWYTLCTNGPGGKMGFATVSGPDQAHVSGIGGTANQRTNPSFVSSIAAALADVIGAQAKAWVQTCVQKVSAAVNSDQSSSGGPSTRLYESRLRVGQIDLRLIGNPGEDLLGIFMSASQGDLAAWNLDVPTSQIACQAPS
jgi:hypothetical protein